MNGNHYYSKKELHKTLSYCVNKTLGEVDKNGVFKRALKFPKITGIAGDVIEQSVLGYPPDTKQAPDLNVDGVPTELKVTGLKRTKNEREYEAKEPMSITAVSPNTIINENFYDSKFYHKIAFMLIVYYLYDSKEKVPAIEYRNFPIMDYDFFSFSKEDLEIIKKDWEIVRNFIIHLRETFEDYEKEYPGISTKLRHELLYLDTAPKWPHNPRFRIKRSVVTSMWEICQGKHKDGIYNNVDTFEELDRICGTITKRFRNKNVNEILKALNIEKKVSKSMMESVVTAMFGSSAKKMNDIELFSKIGLISKTIILNKDGKRTEDVKFCPVNFEEIKDNNINFRESEIYDYFNSSHFLFSIFKEPFSGAGLSECVFLGFKRITFEESFVENNLNEIFSHVRSLILNDELKDVVITDKDGKPVINKCGTVRAAPNFPKSSENIIFFRGTSSDSRHKPLNINGIQMTRQNWWVRGDFIVQKLKEMNFLE